LERAKKRLGEKAAKVQWIVSDITSFQPQTTFHFWHDRAVFHFLTTPEDIQQYISIAEAAVTGFLSMGTFAETGPLKCSGLQITQYSINSLQEKFSAAFEPVKCFEETHNTPMNTMQQFSFCLFKKK